MKVKLQIRKKKKEAARIHLLLFIISSLTLFFILTFLHKKEPLPEEKGGKKEVSQPQTSEAPLALNKSREIIRKGKTLTDILRPYSLSPAEVHNLRREARPVYDLSKIKAGHEIRVFTNPQGKIASLEYDIDEVNYLQVRIEENACKAEIKKIPYEYRMLMVWGIIEDNLISAVIKENERSILALMLADVFAWDIDFYADLRQGDSFKVIFEKKYLQGEFAGYGNILAAEFTNQGRKFQAFRYTYPDTRESDYFNREGNSLRKEFLKSPIRFTRITSRFSRSRLHPIHKVYRPHYGVDYAAKVGTPVQATAEGTVTFAGWNGASGRMITIRHKNGYETMYLHLRGYAEGIKKGAKVRGSQEIAYVGASGEATGPHLDYRIKYRGKYINPLAFNPEPVKPLRAEYLEDFKKKAQSCSLCLEAPLIIYFFLSSPGIQPW
jgi:murein DD-endopeptidase MepM/ murein hydrolase activator NlpD